MTAPFTLLRPFWLLALLPVAWAAWSLWRRQDARTAWGKVIAPHLLDHLMLSPGGTTRIRPIHTLMLSWMLGVIALAGPSWQWEPSPFAEDEAGMVILLKVSPSMLATDVQPNRLARAKHKLRDLLARRQAGATALIAYSGSAHLVMPLTRDSGIINSMAEGLLPETMPIEGDVLTEALKLAETVVERAETGGSILVLADAVAPGEAAALQQNKPDLSLPIQFLSLNAPGAPVEPALLRTARALNAEITSLSVDDRDVETVVRRAHHDVRSVVAAQNGQRRRDAGYWLLPLIALCAVLGGRKGWVVT